MKAFSSYIYEENAFIFLYILYKNDKVKLIKKPSNYKLMKILSIYDKNIENNFNSVIIQYRL